MKTKNQRLLSVASALVALFGATILISFTEVKEKVTPIGFAKEKLATYVYYTVDKSQTNWVMRSGGGTYTVLFHSGREFYPCATVTLSPTNSVVIAPGQWVAIDLNNGYGMGYASDADHR